MSKLGKELRSQRKPEFLLRRVNACLEIRWSPKEMWITRWIQKKAKTLKEIRDLKTKIVELLDDMEAAFIKELDTLHESHANELKASISDGQL